MLAQVESVEDAIDLRDYAGLAAEFAKRAKLGRQAENHARAIVFKAERRIAEFVDAGQADGTIAGQATHGRSRNSVPDGNTVPPATLPSLGLTAKQVHEARKVAGATDADIDAVAEEATRGDKPLTRKAVTAPHVTRNSGNNEWYTPAGILNAAKATFTDDDCCFFDCPEGVCDCPPITTDPASSAVAQRNVGAKTFYTVTDDGLQQPWLGNVWLNPPYSSDLVGRFIDKLLAEHSAGRVRQACVLVNNATETQWAQRLLERAAAVCFLRGRVRYLDADGNPANTPLQGQMVGYLGGQPRQFTESFHHLGLVMAR
jgi:hypothetical protein